MTIESFCEDNFFMNLSQLEKDLEKNGINYSTLETTSDSFSTKGNYVTGGDISVENVVMKLEFQSGKWQIIFEKRKKAWKKILLPIKSENWSFHCTFIQFLPDIFFFASDTKTLTVIAGAIAFLSSDAKITCNVTRNSYLGVFLLSNQDKTKLKLLHLQNSNNSNSFGVDFPFFTPEYSNRLIPNTFFTTNFKDNLLGFIILPYIGVDSIQLKPLPVMYYTEYPEEFQDLPQDDALLLSLAYLSKRTLKKQEITQEETPLELHRQKLKSELDSYQAKAREHKAFVEHSFIINKSIPGSPMDQAQKIVYPNRNISDLLDFHGNATITGKDAYDQLMSLAGSFQ